MKLDDQSPYLSLAHRIVVVTKREGPRYIILSQLEKEQYKSVKNKLLGGNYWTQ